MKILSTIFMSVLLAIEGAIAQVPEVEPPDFTMAMNFFRANKWIEAKAKFEEVKSPNNFQVQVDYYEMECLRKLGDLDGLAAARKGFDKSALTIDYQIRQFELYEIWDGVRQKNWKRIDELCAELARIRLPGDQRAQVAYCHGRALEGLQRTDEALLAYQTALTANPGGSEEIFRPAALRILRIHKDDPEVQTAMERWGAPNQDIHSVGYTNLIEAAGVARLFKLALGEDTALPAELRDFLRFQQKR